MRKILVVSGGYAGFYTAWRLEKGLRWDEAELTREAVVSGGKPGH